MSVRAVVHIVQREPMTGLVGQDPKASSRLLLHPGRDCLKTNSINGTRKS